MEVDELTGEWVHPVHTSSGSGCCETGIVGNGTSNSSSSGRNSGRGSRVPMVQTYSSALGGYHHHPHHSSCDGGSSSASSLSGSNRVIVHRAKRMRMFYP
jgi:hypothetical protein